MTESNNIPVHSECMISYPYGVPDSGYSCGWHTGVDIVPHGQTENYPLLYPVFNNMEVVAINTNPNNALGIYVLLYDGTYYWRYCHLRDRTLQVQVGDVLSKLDAIARMDTTGTNVTGRHLHLECSSSAIWNCNTFVNPCNIMGIPNIDDEVLDWVPSPVPIERKKHKFNFVLFNRKRRFK